MSVFFDCLWWWRGEFENKANPYAEAGAIQPTTSRSNPAGLQITTSEDQDLAVDGTMFDLSHVPDWDWDTLCDTHWD